MPNIPPADDFTADLITYMREMFNSPMSMPTERESLDYPFSPVSINTHTQGQPNMPTLSSRLSATMEPVRAAFTFDGYDTTYNTFIHASTAVLYPDNNLSIDMITDLYAGWRQYRHRFMNSSTTSYRTNQGFQDLLYAIGDTQYVVDRLKERAITHAKILGLSGYTQSDIIQYANESAQETSFTAMRSLIRDLKYHVRRIDEDRFDQATIQEFEAEKDFFRSDLPELCYLPIVKSVQFYKDGLLIYMNPFTLTGDEFDEEYEVDFDNFIVHLSFRGMQPNEIIRIYNSNPPYDYVNGQFFHPHVDTGTMCWGNHSTQFMEMLEAGNITAALSVVFNILTNYNSESPYVSLWKWTEDLYEQFSRYSDEEDEHLVYSEYHEEHIDRDDALFSEYLNDYLLADDATSVRVYYSARRTDYVIDFVTIDDATHSTFLDCCLINDQTVEHEIFGVIPSIFDGNLEALRDIDPDLYDEMLAEYEGDHNDE